MMSAYYCRLQTIATLQASHNNHLSVELTLSKELLKLEMSFLNPISDADYATKRVKHSRKANVNTGKLGAAPTQVWKLLGSLGKSQS